MGNKETYVCTQFLNLSSRSHLAPVALTGDISNSYGLPMHFIKFALNWMQAAQEGLKCEKCSVLPIKSKLFVTSGQDSNNNNNNNTWRTIALVVVGLFVAVCIGFCFYKKVISKPSQTSPPEQHKSDENEALCEVNGTKELLERKNVSNASIWPRFEHRSAIIALQTFRMQNMQNTRAFCYFS